MYVCKMHKMYTKIENLYLFQDLERIYFINELTSLNHL